METEELLARAWTGEGIYLTGEDNLRLTTFGALASAIVTVEGRIVRPDGTVHFFSETHTPNSDRTSATKLLQLGRGVLTHAHARVTTGTAVIGHIFGVLELVRGFTGGVVPMATLAQGYITSAARLAWPGSPLLPSVGPHGRPRTISGTDPAAGVELSETVPAGARWLLKTFNLALLADATVANRAVIITIDDGTNIVWQVGTNINVTASQLAIYRLGVGLPFLTIGTTHYNLPIPAGLILGPGYRIRTITTNLQAGDNYTAPVYHVEEFIDG